MSTISEVQGIITPEAFVSAREIRSRGQRKILCPFSLLLVTLQAFELRGMPCLPGIYLSCVMTSPTDCRVCYAKVVGISRHLRIFFAGNTEKETYDRKDEDNKDCRVFHDIILP